MKVRTVLLSLALLLSVSGAGHARFSAANEPGTLAARADAKAARITDAAEFIEEVDLSIKMARRGDYGPLRRGDMDRLENAQTQIKTLLDGYDRATDMEPQARIDLYNAQELITATLRNDEKDRKICKRAPTTGSRLTKTECMTVAQREARAKRARENLVELQRSVCSPTAFVPCGE